MEDIDFPQSGVGDLDDLKVYLRSGEGGNWLGFVHTGWYYHNNIEQYNYAVRGLTLVEPASAGVNLVQASDTFNPSWGPILVYSKTDAQPYTPHQNSFFPAAQLSWTPSASGLYRASVPASSFVVSVRDLTNLPLGAVASSGMVTHPRLYCYDQPSGYIYIRPRDPANIDVWVDLLYTYPRLKFRELVVQQPEGVFPTYRDIEQVTVYRGSQSQSVSGTVNPLGSSYSPAQALSHGLSGVNVGDWVVLEYYIRRSYTIADHDKLLVYTTQESGEDIQVFYEAGNPFRIPPLTVGGSGSTYVGLLSLNTLYPSSHRAGYLFHASPTVPGSSLWSVRKISVRLNRDEFCPELGEKLHLSAVALGDNDLPVPWAPLTVGGLPSSAMVPFFPSLSFFDGRGEFHATISAPPSSGAVVVTLTSGSQTAVASAMALSASQYLPASTYRESGATTVVTSRRTALGYFQSYASTSHLDGIPTSGGQMEIRTRLASSLTPTGVSGDGLGEVASGRLIVFPSRSPDNPIGIVEFGYLPQPGDEIFSRVANGASPRVEVDD